MIAYVVASWAIVQVVDVLLPAFNGPAWGVRAVTSMLVVGFPMVLILSWLFDLDSSGLVRTPDAAGTRQLKATRWFRLLVVVPTAVVTVAAVWYLWTADYIANEGADWKSAPRENPVIAVLPARNLTGDDSLDWLGDGFAKLLRNQLASSKHTIMVSDSGLEPILRDRSDLAEVVKAASVANIDYLISGEIIRSPAGLILTQRVTDVSANIDVVAQSFPDLSNETLIGSVDGVVRIVMQGLRLPYVQQQQSLAADFAVDNFAAYEAFNAGLMFFNDFEYEDAVSSLETALELAPDFHIARYRLAHILVSMGEEQRAQEMIASIPDDIALSRREELYIDAARAYIPADMETAIERYKLILEEFPYEIDARVFLAEAYYQNYMDAAAIEQLRLIVAQEPENVHGWTTLGYYELQLGNVKAARQAISRYAELSPDEAHPWTLKGDIAAQEREFAAAIAHYDKALSLEPDFSLAALGSARARIALGERDAAKTLLWQVVRNDDVIAADRTDAALDLAFLLRAEFRYAESITPLRELADVFRAEAILESKALTTEALSLLELGETDAAFALFDGAIEKSPGNPVRYLFAKGMAQIRMGQVERAQATANEILGHALPPEDGNQRAEKAADYLVGRISLGAGNAEEALKLMRRAVEAQGFEYAVYDIGLAEAYAKLARFDEALEVIDRASELRFEGSALRIEFERERRLAEALRADILDASGRSAEADELRQAYARRWNGAEPAPFR